MARGNGEEPQVNVDADQHQTSESNAPNAGTNKAPRLHRFACIATDFCYFIAVLVTSPIWLVRMIVTGKIKTDWSARLGAGLILRRTARPRVLLHAVSVGEVNAIRGLVERLGPAKRRVDPAVADALALHARVVDVRDGLVREADVFVRRRGFGPSLS